MKKKLILLLICILGTTIISSTIFFSKKNIISEAISLEESANQPTWSVIYKDHDDYISNVQTEYAKHYQAAYEAAYQKYYDQYLEYYMKNPLETTIPQATNTNNTGWNNRTKVKNGKDGKDGRGIDHCELDAEKNLYVYYTDGTIQNVGNLAIPTDETNTPEFEQIGYRISCDYPKTPQKVNVYVDEDYTLLDDGDIELYLYFDDLYMELVEINENEPVNKYKYKLLYKCHYSDISLPYVLGSIPYKDMSLNIELEISIDNKIGEGFRNVTYYTDSNEILQEKYITSPFPYTNLKFGYIGGGAHLIK